MTFIMKSIQILSGNVSRESHLPSSGQLIDLNKTAANCENMVEFLQLIWCEKQMGEIDYSARFAIDSARFRAFRWMLDTLQA